MALMETTTAHMSEIRAYLYDLQFFQIHKSQNHFLPVQIKWACYSISQNQCLLSTDNLGIYLSQTRKPAF